MKIIPALAFVAFSITAFSQSAIKNFTLPDVAGSPVSLDSYPSIPGIVVIFTSNECAFDNYYTARIKSLVELYSGKVQFLLINANADPNESVEKMKIKYASWGLHVPYLADKDQVALNIFGAKKSPEAFLVRNVGGQFVIVYSGALDDNPQVASDVKQNYLKISIDRLLAGQQVEIPMNRAIGCSIRKK